MDLEDERPSPLQDRPPELVLAAFRQARHRGKPDWWRMTTPVLKNRMLQLDPERLDELIGERSFRAWVEAQSSLSTTPVGSQAMVELPEPVKEYLEAEDTSGPEADASVNWRKLRVRPDLWRAMIDYDSGARYVWDAATQTATLASADDLRPRLPTFTPEDLRGLRTSFAAEVPEADLADWVSGSGSTDDLPKRLRGPWNEVLKKEVVGRLRHWFAGQRSAPIPEITQQATVEARDVSEAASARACLHRLADVMTPTELGMVSIPLSAVARILEP